MEAQDFSTFSASISRLTVDLILSSSRGGGCIRSNGCKIRRRMLICHEYESKSPRFDQIRPPSEGHE